MKGQLSAEMLILLVVLVAVVGLVAAQMLGAAKKSGETISQKTDEILEKASGGVKGEEGAFCIDDSDCAEGLSCSDNRCS